MCSFWDKSNWDSKSQSDSPKFHRSPIPGCHHSVIMFFWEEYQVGFISEPRFKKQTKWRFSMSYVLPSPAFHWCDVPVSLLCAGELPHTLRRSPIYFVWIGICFSRFLQSAGRKISYNQFGMALPFSYPIVWQSTLSTWRLEDASGIGECEWDWKVYEPGHITKLKKEANYGTQRYREH